MKRGLLFCVLAAAILAAGCGRISHRNPQTPVEGAVRIENIQVENYYELGPNVEYFPQKPQRVLAIGANEAETILDLGAEDCLIGTLRFQDHPRFGIKACHRAAYEKLPALARREVNAEKFLELRPDLIVAQQEFYSKQRLGSTAYWNSKGVATMVPLNTTSPGKLNAKETIAREMQFIRDMGRILGKEERAEKIIRDTQARLAEIRAATASAPKPKVMVLDLMSIIASYGRDKIAGDIVGAIGGDVPHTTAAVSEEWIMKENPDVVFLVSYGDDEAQLSKIRGNPAFRSLNFIRNQKLFPIPLKYVYGPETRTIDAAGYMAERMYPGKFHFPPEYRPGE